jgi:hypothetical protein
VRGQQQRLAYVWLIYHVESLLTQSLVTWHYKIGMQSLPRRADRAHTRESRLPRAPPARVHSRDLASTHLSGHRESSRQHCADSVRVPPPEARTHPQERLPEPEPTGKPTAIGTIFRPGANSESTDCESPVSVFTWESSPHRVRSPSKAITPRLVPHS